MEQFIDMLLQCSALRCIFTSQLIRLFEFTSNGGRLFIDLHLVPALLEEVGTVVISAVGVTESDVFDIVVGLVESISDHTWEGWMSTGNDVYEH